MNDKKILISGNTRHPADLDVVTEPNRPGPPEEFLESGAGGHLFCSGGWATDWLFSLYGCLELSDY